MVDRQGARVHRVALAPAAVMTDGGDTKERCRRPKAQQGRPYNAIAT